MRHKKRHVYLSFVVNRYRYSVVYRSCGRGDCIVGVTSWERCGNKTRSLRHVAAAVAVRGAEYVHLIRGKSIHVTGSVWGDIGTCIGFIGGGSSSSGTSSSASSSAAALQLAPSTLSSRPSRPSPLMYGSWKQKTHISIPLINLLYSLSIYKIK